MDTERTQTVTRQPYAGSFESIDNGSDESQERLNVLLALNAEIRREKEIFRTLQEQIEAEMMRHPVPVKKAFAYFGLILGTFSPAAIFLKIFPNAGSADVGLIIMFLFVNFICAVTGYFSGKLIGKMVWEMEKRSWHSMLLTLPFIGIVWGIITGGAGGALIFLIGALFGAFFAAIVGSLALPAFAIFHRLLKKGEMIERNQLLPIAFGITFIISALILGL